MHHLGPDGWIELPKTCRGTDPLLTARVVAPKALDEQGGYEEMYRREEAGMREVPDRIRVGSWGDEVAPTHTEPPLLRLMRKCGYARAMAKRTPHKPEYAFYPCLPSPERQAAEPNSP